MSKNIQAAKRIFRKTWKDKRKIQSVAKSACNSMFKLRNELNWYRRSRKDAETLKFSMFFTILNTNHRPIA